MRRKKKLFFVGTLSAADEKADPNPEASGTDPQIRIRTKMSRIYNTAVIRKNVCVGGGASAGWYIIPYPGNRFLYFFSSILIRNGGTIYEKKMYSWGDSMFKTCCVQTVICKKESVLHFAKFFENVGTNRCLSGIPH